MAGEDVRQVPLTFKRSRQEKEEHYRRKAEREERRAHRQRRRLERDAIADPTSSNSPASVDAAFHRRMNTRAGHSQRPRSPSNYWSAKLGELLQDDVNGGFSEYGGRSAVSGEDAFGAEDAAWEEEMARMKHDSAENSFRYERDVPKRWRDAASHAHRTHLSKTAGYTAMDDEEYAEYIRDGMYRRKHAREIAFEEERRRRWDEEERKRQKESDERRAERAKRRQKRDKEDTIRRLRTSRDAWEEAWLVVEKPGSTAFTSWTAKRVPLPVLREVSPHRLETSLTKENVCQFIFGPSSSQSDANEQEDGARRLRICLRRYHPDRFLSSALYTSITSDTERKEVHALILRISQILSEIVDDRRA